MADAIPVTTTTTTTPATAIVVQTAPVTVQPETHTAMETGFVTVTVMGHQFSFSPMVCLLFGAFAIIIFYLWKAQRSQYNHFNVWDLVMDTVPKVPDALPTTRHTSLIKVAFCSAFGVATWVVVDQQIKGTLRGDIFGMYIMGVLGAIIAKLFWDKPFDPATILAMWGGGRDKKEGRGRDHD